MHTFRNWLLFEATKVTDSSGKPLVVWHGSHNDFDKFRTYNFIINEVTDHRLDRSTKNVKAVMKGELDLIIG